MESIANHRREEGAAAAPPFRGPAADSRVGELFLDVIGLVAAMGFAADVSQCVYVCGLTFRRGDRGAINDMLIQSLRLQCGAREARAAVREDFTHERVQYYLRKTTQLMRAVILNNLPRVLQLVQLGAPLDTLDSDMNYSALGCACRFGFEEIASALLDGKYEGGGAMFLDNNGPEDECTPLAQACEHSQVGIVRLLIARGARVDPTDSYLETALHIAVKSSPPEIVKLLCSAPGWITALRRKIPQMKTVTPLELAEKLCNEQQDERSKEIVAILRAAEESIPHPRNVLM